MSGQNSFAMLFMAADSICVPQFRAVLEAGVRLPLQKRKTIPQRLTLRKRKAGEFRVYALLYAYRGIENR